MKYYKTLENEKIMLLIESEKTLKNATEITEEEYYQLMAEFEARQAKIADYVEKIKAGEITLEEVPTEYRTEVEAIINVPEPVDPKQALIDEIIAEVNA